MSLESLALTSSLNVRSSFGPHVSPFTNSTNQASRQDMAQRICTLCFQDWVSYTYSAIFINLKAKYYLEMKSKKDENSLETFSSQLFFSHIKIQSNSIIKSTFLDSLSYFKLLKTRIDLPLYRIGKWG